MKTSKIIALLVVCIMIISLFAGCTAKPAPVTNGEKPVVTEPAKKMKIGLSMDSLESAFWIANHKAILDKAKELDVEIVEMMAEGDANKQNQQMENLIALGVDAIICAPKDGGAIISAIKKCKEAGIPVIMDNRPVQGDIKPELQVLSDNYVMAKDVMQWFVDKAKKDGKKYNAMLLVGNLGDENAVERQKGHKEILDANKDVITLAAEVPTEWNHEVALKGMQNALQAHPEINLIITPSDFLFPPIKSVLEQNKKWAKFGEPNHMPIISFDGDEVGMQHLKDGYNWADAAQAADKTGWTCVEWAIKLAKGEKPAQDVIRDPGVLANMDNLSEVGPTIWGWSLVK